MSAATSTQAVPASEGRDANGRFVKGNKFGRGNPFARQVAQLRKEMFAMVMDGPYFTQIVMQLQQLAADGHVIAIKLLFQYLFGKPTEGVDPDRLDIEEWKIHKEQAEQYQAVLELMNTPKMEAPLELVNRMRWLQAAGFSSWRRRRHVIKMIRTNAKSVSFLHLKPHRTERAEAIFGSGKMRRCINLITPVAIRGQRCSTDVR